MIGYIYQRTLKAIKKMDTPKELELKHVVPYLPFNLKFQWVNEFNPPFFLGIQELLDLSNREKNGHGCVNSSCVMSFNIKDIKPLLIPLDWLTVPNAEGLTPMHELLEIDLKQMDVKPIYFVTECKRRDYDLLKKHDYVICYVMDDTVYHLVFDPEYNRFTSRQISPIERPLWTDYQPLHEYLISNHWDVNSLIDASLALNKLDYIK